MSNIDLHGPSDGTSFAEVSTDEVNRQVNNALGFKIETSALSNAAPLPASPLGLAGISTNVARADHVHPGSGGSADGFFLPLSGGTMVGPLNYTATGGTTSRSVQERAADWVHLEDYGAKLDGVTNDGAAYAAARTAAASRGGNIGGVIVAPPSGKQATFAKPTYTAPPVLWKIDGLTFGTAGLTPVTNITSGDLIESYFSGVKYFQRTDAIGAPGSPVLRLDYTGAGSSQGVLNINSTLTDGNNFLANITSILTATGNGDSTGPVGIGSVVRRTNGSCPLWLYWGNLNDSTGLGKGALGSETANRYGHVMTEISATQNGPDNPESVYDPHQGGRVGLHVAGANYAPPNWAATHAYAINAPIAPGNGYTYYALNAGTSAASPPVWPITPPTATVADGTVTWRLGTTVRSGISRMIGVTGDIDIGAALAVANVKIYDAGIELSTCTLDTTRNPNAAGIRLGTNMPIDFSGDGTTAGQNKHYLQYTSTGTARLRYMVGASERWSIDDSGNAVFAGTVTASGSGINLSAPPPIGNTTPNTGAFTTLSSAGNLAVTGNLTATGITSLGNTGSNNYVQALGATNPSVNPIIQVAGAGTNGALILRGQGTGGINLASLGSGNIAQFFAGATNGDTIFFRQPATTAVPFVIGTTAAGSGGIRFDSFVNVGAGPPIVLSGAPVGPHWFSVGNDLSGSVTSVADVMARVGSTNDTATTTNNIYMFQVLDRLGAGWGGSRTAFTANVNDIAATTNGRGMVAASLLAATNYNRGGVAAGYGTGANVGLGTNWGAVIGVDFQAGATWANGGCPLEIDYSVQTGANVFEGYGIQIAQLGPQHQVQAVYNEAAMRIANQPLVGKGWKDALLTFGSYPSQWPLDPNGYIIQVQSSAPPVFADWPARGAGGIDFNQFTASGVGREGGGFQWRSPGVQIKDTEVQIGYASLGADANGLVVTPNYQRMSASAGAITVADGGTSIPSLALYADAYGNVVQVFMPSGSTVTSISQVITRGWQQTPPANPVTFRPLTRNGGIGSNITLNLTWTPLTGITIGGSASKVGFYNATPVVKQTGVAVTIAAVHAALVNLGLIAP